MAVQINRSRLSQYAPAIQRRHILQKYQAVGSGIVIVKAVERLQSFVKGMVLFDLAGFD